MRLLLAAGIALAACSPDDGQRIDEYIRGAGLLPAADPKFIEGPPSEPTRDGDYSCTEHDVGETIQLDRVVAYEANSEALWPGALVSGRSVTSGLLTQRVLARAPMSFSVSLSSLTGERSAWLESPDLSSYREALASLLNSELEGATAANIVAEIEEVHSEKQLELALGVRADGLGALGKIGGSLELDKSEIRSRFVVRYIQSYFTADVDPVERPSALFAPEVSFDDVAEQIPPDDPTAYVSSVTYGRIIMFTVTSSVSSSELRAALEFAYGQGVGVSGEVSLSNEEILEQSTITAYVLGGSGDLAARNIDSLEGLRELIATGGNYSPDSPGAPIAYRLNYVADNSPARLSLSQQYTVRDCARVSQRVQITLRGIKVEEAGDDGGELELFGVVWAAGQGEPAELFHRGADTAVTIAEGETWPEGGPLAEAIVDVTPQSGQVIRLGAGLVDRDGGFDSDDSLGEIVIEAPFESGWRRQSVVYMTGGGGSRVEVLFDLKPI